MEHLIVYQVRYKKVIVSSFLINFQYTTAVNVKTRRVYILHERFLLSINQVTVRSLCSCSGVSSLKNSDNETY